jgi:hypothetical protein
MDTGIPAIQIEEPEFDSMAIEEAMAATRPDAEKSAASQAVPTLESAPERVPAPERASEPAPELSPEAQDEVPEALFTQEELDQLWNDIFEQAEPLAATTNSMRRATLAAVGERQFKVIAPSAMAKGILQMDSELISDLMTRQLGREMHMVVKVQGEGPAAEERNAEEIARRASAVLGTEVKLTD